MKAVSVLLMCSVLSACVTCPDTMRVEVEHVSHPFAGWPFGSRYEEDSLTQASVLAEWTSRDAYLDIGIGRNLLGQGGGGFYGPSLTAIARAGVVIKLGGGDDGQRSENHGLGKVGQ